MAIGGAGDEDRYESMELRLRNGTTVTVYVPEGSLPSAVRILDMIAPASLSPSRWPQRVYTGGQDWLVPEQASLAAIAVLPQRTREALLAVYPKASPASRAHLAEQLHAYCASELADFEEAMVDAYRDLPVLSAGDGPTAGQVGNVLAARHVLDAAFGADSFPRLRFKFLPAALSRYERGRSLDPARLRELDERMRALAALPETDYLATEASERERALAYTLVHGLAVHAQIPTPALAYWEEPIDATAQFARRHLGAPDRYAEAVRRERTFDPERLREVIGEGA